MSYKIPPYASLKLDVAFHMPGRRPYLMELAITDIGEGGVEDILERVVAAATARGFVPMTEELFAEHTKKEQEDKWDAMLAEHIGRAGGGDA